MIYNLLNWWLNHKHSNWISVVGHLNDCFLWLAKKIRSWENCDIPKSSICSSPSVYFIISLDLFPSFYGPNSLQYNLSYSPSGELGVHGESIKEDECSWWGWRGVLQHGERGKFFIRVSARRKVWILRITV